MNKELEEILFDYIWLKKQALTQHSDKICINMYDPKVDEARKILDKLQRDKPILEEK